MTNPIEEATLQLAEALRDVVLAAAAHARPEVLPPPPAGLDWHPQRAYTIAQVAAWLKVGTTYVYDEVKAGRLRMADFGNGDRKKERVRGSDLDAWWQRRYV